MQKLLKRQLDVLAISEHWLYADELTILDNLHNDFVYYAKTSEQNNMNTRWKRGQGGGCDCLEKTSQGTTIITRK
jgi:hypothetical protein